MKRIRSSSWICSPASGTFTSDTLWNGAAQLVPQLMSLATIPILLNRLGVAGFGVWALVNTVIVVAVSLDGGLSLSAQRYYALYLSKSDHRAIAGLTTTLTAAVILIFWLDLCDGRSRCTASHVRCPSSPRTTSRQHTEMFRNLGGPRPIDIDQQYCLRATCEREVDSAGLLSAPVPGNVVFLFPTSVLASPHGLTSLHLRPRPTICTRRGSCNSEFPRGSQQLICSPLSLPKLKASSARVAYIR